jgi:hypothetical protein
MYNNANWQEEFWEDGYSAFGTVLRFRPHDASIDFEVYEIVALEGSNIRHFEVLGAASSADTTTDIEYASPAITGLIKFDGCSHVWFGERNDKDAAGDGYMHLCGRSCWDWLIETLDHVRRRCGELITIEW